MRLRSLILAAFFFSTPSFAATPPAGPQDAPPLPDGQLVVGQEVAFGQRAGFSRDFTFVTAGLEAERAYVYTNGFVALGFPPADDFDAVTGPLADRPRPAVPVILPLHADLGGTCPDLAADEAATFNRVEYAVEDDDLIIIWRAMLPAEPDCGSKLAAQASTFAARLSWGETFDVTYTYVRLAPGLAPRAGVMLPQGAFELYPDGGKPRTDRVFVLATEGSEGFPGDENTARSWTRGLWVMQFDDEGRIVGDTDGDGVRSADNCRHDANPTQSDLDLDGEGNVCDGDIDGDGRLNAFDNCTFMSNNDQLDSDADGLGDACDGDDDGDGLFDHLDTCPLTFDPINLDRDGDGLGDVCDIDIDGDDARAAALGTRPRGDRCPYLWDPADVDSDRDGIGDACDLAPKDHCQDAWRCQLEVDSDADGIPDVEDVCPTVPDPTQTDSDGDGIGNPCDGDCNGDGRWDVYQPAVQAGCMALISVDFELEAASFPAYTPAD